MNLNPAIVLDPVFQFLNEIIAEYGIYIFIAFVWLAVVILAWVFSGGLRRKFPNQPNIQAGIGIVIKPHAPPQLPPPPIIIREQDSSGEESDVL